MPVEGNEQIFRAITPRQLDLLRLLPVERRHARLAALMHVSVATVRSHIRVLCELTDCHGTDELWDWWRDHNVAYVAFIANRAGVRVETFALHQGGAPNVRDETF